MTDKRQENLACEQAPNGDGKKIRRAKRADEHETEEFRERSDRSETLRSSPPATCSQATKTRIPLPPTHLAGTGGGGLCGLTLNDLLGPSTMLNLLASSRSLITSLRAKLTELRLRCSSS